MVDRWSRSRRCAAAGRQLVDMDAPIGARLRGDVRARGHSPCAAVARQQRRASHARACRTAPLALGSGVSARMRGSSHSSHSSAAPQQQQQLGGAAPKRPRRRHWPRTSRTRPRPASPLPPCGPASPGLARPGPRVEPECMSSRWRPSRSPAPRVGAAIIAKSFAMRDRPTPSSERAAQPGGPSVRPHSSRLALRPSLTCAARAFSGLLIRLSTPGHAGQKACSSEILSRGDNSVPGPSVPLLNWHHPRTQVSVFASSAERLLVCTKVLPNTFPSSCCFLPRPLPQICKHLTLPAPSSAKEFALSVLGS